MRRTWLLHGTQDEPDLLKRSELQPGKPTRYGEPSACWLTSKLSTARYFAMRPKDRRTWDQTPDLSHELTLTLEQPVDRDMDFHVLIVDARGLTIERFPSFSCNFAVREPIDGSRIVGTLEALGVDQVLSGLWPDPKR
jgi:hypothetical protein